MINISCSQLELVRHDPITYAKSLSNGTIQKGGTHGMFAYWQDVAKRMHQEGLTISETLKELSSIYRRRFEVNQRNERKQESLYSSLVNYEKVSKGLKLSFYEGKHRMQWPLIPEIQLTGLTPWVFKKGNLFYAYFYSEQTFIWQAELRFPLLQHYMAKHIISCDLKDLNIGFYFLDHNSFESRNYSSLEVKVAIDETVRIFEKVSMEISRRKILKK